MIVPSANVIVTEASTVVEISIMRNVVVAGWRLWPSNGDVHCTVVDVEQTTTAIHRVCHSSEDGKQDLTNAGRLLKVLKGDKWQTNTFSSVTEPIAAIAPLVSP